MPESNLPDALLKIGLALAKHHIKNVIGDEALEVVADTLADVGGEKVQAKVDSIFASKEGEKELLKAAKNADEKFKKECQNGDLRQLFSMDYGSLPSVQEAIGKLPEALGDEALKETLFTAFRNDAPKRIGDEKINEGVNLYVECLQSALIPVKDFGLRIIYNTLIKIGKDVGDIKKALENFEQQIYFERQDTRETKSSYARFLLPFPHNPDFVGRETELSNLHELLQHGGSIVGIRPTVLVGLGGIGKTQLAAEYAHAHRDNYPSGVFWLNAINPLLFEFSDLAEKLDMANRDTPRDKAARKAWDYLDSHPDALVIFDNVLEPSQLNMPFSPDLVPANLRCRTLFTTRQRDFPRTFQPFEVKILPEKAAMKLLLRSRPEVLEEHHPEWGWARIVCAELGWLPLALELAAAYLGAYPEVSITGYLERLRVEGSLETVDESEVRALNLPTRVEEILKAVVAGDLEAKHQVAVSATLQTQWKRLDDEDAKLLFRAAGQFPEASWILTPRLGLLTSIESEAKPGRPSPLTSALKKLHAVSLIEELSEGRLRLHPLVQEFSEHLSPTAFRFELARRLAAKLYDFSQLQSRVIRYGVHTVIEDIRTGLRFTADSPHDKVYEQLNNLDRALDRIAHNLNGWNPDIRLSFMLQELYNEATYLGFKDIRACAERTLAEYGLQYLLHKNTSHEESKELLRTLIAHEKEVQSVAISADGKIAISGATDNTLIIWDVEGGTKLHTLQCEGYDIESSIWDGDYGQGVEISGEHRRIGLNNNTVALSPDGKLAISISKYRANRRSSDSANAIVWDVKTGHELRRFFSSRAVLIADGTLAYSEEDFLDEHQSKKDIVTSKIIHTQVVDLMTGLDLVSDPAPLMSEKYFKIIDSLQNVDGSLTLSPNEHNIKFLQWKSKAFESDDKGQLFRVAMSADGQLAVSAMPDNTLTVWDVVSGQELCVLVGHLAQINDVAMSADGQIIISASSDKTLKVWNISTAINEYVNKSKQSKPTSHETHNQSHDGAVEAIEISADGSLGISVSRGTIKLWNVVDAIELSTHSISYFVNSTVLSENNKTAILGTRDKNIKVIDIDSWHELCTLEGHSSWVTDVSISSDAQIMVSASSDKTLKVWKMSPLDKENFRKFDELYTLRGHTKDVVDIALSKDGRLCISASMDHTLKMWDVLNGKEIRTIPILSEPRHVALSANGQIAFSTADRDARIRVWNVSDGQETHSLKNHKHGIVGMAINAKGDLAASIIDKILNVWNINTARIIATYRSKVLLTCCAMSADGTRILVGDEYGSIHFLELFGADKISTGS